MAKEQDQKPDQDADRIRDEALKRALTKPHKPQGKKVGKQPKPQILESSLSKKSK